MNKEEWARYHWRGFVDGSLSISRYAKKIGVSYKRLVSSWERYEIATRQEAKIISASKPNPKRSRRCRRCQIFIDGVGLYCSLCKEEGHRPPPKVEKTLGDAIHEKQESEGYISTKEVSTLLGVKIGIVHYIYKMGYIGEARKRGRWLFFNKKVVLLYKEYYKPY